MLGLEVNIIKHCWVSDHKKHFNSILYYNVFKFFLYFYKASIKNGTNGKIKLIAWNNTVAKKWYVFTSLLSNGILLELLRTYSYLFTHCINKRKGYFLVYYFRDIKHLNYVCNLPSFSPLVITTSIFIPYYWLLIEYLRV